MLQCNEFIATWYMHRERVYREKGRLKSASLPGIDSKQSDRVSSVIIIPVARRYKLP